VCVFVCLFVCQHDIFQSSKRRTMKFLGRCIVQKSRPSSNLGVIAPVVHPKNVALGYDVRKISAGCLVVTIFECELALINTCHKGNMPLITCLTAVYEKPGSNHRNHYNVQPWSRAAHHYYSA